MSMYVAKLIRAQKKIEDARLAVIEATEYSCIPGTTPSETGQEQAKRIAMDGLERARVAMAQFGEEVREHEENEGRRRRGRVDTATEIREARERAERAEWEAAAHGR